MVICGLLIILGNKGKHYEKPIFQKQISFAYKLSLALSSLKDAEIIFPSAPFLSLFLWFSVKSCILSLGLVLWGNVGVVRECWGHGTVSSASSCPILTAKLPGGAARPLKRCCRASDDGHGLNGHPRKHNKEGQDEKVAEYRGEVTN